MISRVHDLISDKVVKQRSNQITEFEELLTEGGTALMLDSLPGIFLAAHSVISTSYSVSSHFF